VLPTLAFFNLLTLIWLPVGYEDEGDEFDMVELDVPAVAETLPFVPMEEDSEELITDEDVEHEDEYVLLMDDDDEELDEEDDEEDFLLQLENPSHVLSFRNKLFYFGVSLLDWFIRTIKI